MAQDVDDDLPHVRRIRRQVPHVMVTFMLLFESITVIQRCQTSVLVTNSLSFKAII